MYSTHDVDNGLKLMEHSYVQNEYVERILSMLVEKPLKLSWVCDYSHDHPWNWDKTTEATKEEFLKDSYYPLQPDHYIINHIKGLYIDMIKFVFMNKEEWLIHPIPILVNSSSESLGGGDYHIEDSRRGTWDMDQIQVVFKFEDIPKDYKDVTTEVYFKE